MNTLDDAVKTFLIWRGVGHLIMIGYASITGYLLLEGFWLGDKLTTQQTFVIGTATGVLPVMVQWYERVMEATKREIKS